jgi:hypothetical protein
VTGDDDATRGEIKAAIALVFAWVADENASSRSRVKFVWSSGIEIGEAEPAKRAQMCVGRVLAKKKEVWGGVADRSGRAYVDEVVGGVEGFHPKRRREIGLDEKSTDNIVRGAQHAFSLDILWGGMRTRQAEGNAVSREKCTEIMVDKFPTVVTLHTFNYSMELSFDIGKETLQSGGGIKFVS